MALKLWDTSILFCLFFSTVYITWLLGLCLWNILRFFVVFLAIKNMIIISLLFPSLLVIRLDRFFQFFKKGLPTFPIVALMAAARLDHSLCVVSFIWAVVLFALRYLHVWWWKLETLVLKLALKSGTSKYFAILGPLLWNLKPIYAFRTKVVHILEKAWNGNAQLNYKYLKISKLQLHHHHGQRQYVFVCGGL